jgi:hypothetical protein
MVEKRCNREIEKIESPGTKNLGLIRRKRNYRTDYQDPTKIKESSDFALKHLKVRDRVLSILRSDRYARENDFFLCLLYWTKCGFIKTNIDLKDFNKITKPESISRCRRELVEKAKKGDKELQFLLNNQETLEERKKAEELYHDYYRENK